MTSETYPSVPGASDRRTVTYTPDGAGRLASLSSSATSYAPAASVTDIGYASHGALNTETYGNGVVHSASYNNRLQTTEISLVSVGKSGTTTLLDLTYTYTATGISNNGNVQSTSYSGGGLSYTQTFTYDALNRLLTSIEKTGSTTNWSQNDHYDQYGNRQIDYGGGSYNVAFSATTNRIATSGFTYDSDGNLTNDTVHAYTYDAEGHIKTIDTVTAYTYDGSGTRVRKLVGENTRFVYGIGGQLIMEFDGSSGNLKKEYVYGGAALATIEPTAVNSNGTQYSTGDNLGTPRLITNSSGSVVARHDYMPFGEELFAGTGGRTTGMGFSSTSENNRKKFTGYERDGETGLDFAQARYNSSALGRFTSPDPFGGSMKQTSPQSFNRYAYVGNNPLNAIDPSGLVTEHNPIALHAKDFDWAGTGMEEDEARYLEMVNDTMTDANASGDVGAAAEFEMGLEGSQSRAQNNSGGDHIQDAVIGYKGESSPGVDDRFNSGHYGPHTLSPENGGYARSLPSLSGTVVYWNVQQYIEDDNGKRKPYLYTVRVRPAGANFYVNYEDLKSVSTAITRHMKQGAFKAHSPCGGTGSPVRCR